MEFIIRPAEPVDAAAVSRLSAQLGYNASPADTEAYIAELTQNPFDGVYVAIVDGFVAGWMHVFRTLRLESGVFAEIGGLVVDEQFRGRGIGEKLVAQAREWCREQNISNLRVRSNVKRTDAHRFYIKAGFTASKQQQVFTSVLQTAQAGTTK